MEDNNNLNRIIPPSPTVSTTEREGVATMPRFFAPRENDATLALAMESPTTLKLSGALSPSKRSSRSRGASPLPRRLGQQHHRGSPSSSSSNNNNRRSPLSPANHGQIAGGSPTTATSHTKSPRRSSPPSTSTTNIMQPRLGSPPRRRSTLSVSSNISKRSSSAGDGCHSNSVSPSSSSSSGNKGTSARRRISLSSLAKDTSILQKIEHNDHNNSNNNSNEKENERENNAASAVTVVAAVVSTSEEDENEEDDSSTNDLIRMLDNALQSMDPTITSTTAVSTSTSSASSGSGDDSNKEEEDDGDDNFLKEILGDSNHEADASTIPVHSDISEAAALLSSCVASISSGSDPTGTLLEKGASEKDQVQPPIMTNNSLAEEQEDEEEEEQEDSEKTNQSAMASSLASNRKTKPTKRVSLVLPATTMRGGDDADDLPILDICTSSQNNDLLLQESLSEHSCLYSDARTGVVDDDDDDDDAITVADRRGSVSSFFTAVESSGCFDQESIASLKALQGSDYFDYILEKDKLIMELKKSFALTKEEGEQGDEDAGDGKDEVNDGGGDCEDLDDQSSSSGHVAHNTESVHCHVKPNQATTDTADPVPIVLSSYNSEEDPQLTEELEKRLSPSNGSLDPLSSTLSTRGSEEISTHLLPSQGAPCEVSGVTSVSSIRGSEDKEDDNWSKPAPEKQSSKPSAPTVADTEWSGSTNSTATMVVHTTKEEGASDPNDCLHPSPRESDLLIDVTPSDLPNSNSQSLSLVLDVFSIYYMYSLLQAEKQQRQPHPQPLLLLMGESSPESVEAKSECGAMVVYSNKPSTETQQIPSVITINSSLMDPEIQYGLALFQLLVIKQNTLLSEENSEPKGQKENLERMVNTLQFCLTLRDESGACSIRMEIAQALDTLGCLHKDSFHDYPQSFLYYTQALETKSHIYGANAKNLELAGSMETLGLLMRDKLGCVSDSIRCFTQALKMKQHVYDQQPTYLPVNNRPTNCARQHAEMAQTYHSLGLAYDMSADYENACSYYEKALSSRKEQQQQYQRKMGRTANQQRRKQQVLVKAKKQLVATLFNLGCVAEKLKRLEEGRSYLEEALQMQYELHAPLKGEASQASASGLIGTLFRLASIYERCKELEGAYKYYKIALDIHYQLQRAQTVKTKHPLLIALLHGAANASNLLGHYEDSLFAYESLMDTLRNEQVKDKRLLIPTLHHLGLLNDVLGNVAKASKYYRFALGIMESQENLQESPAAINIRMNVLCLSEPMSEDPKPRLPAQGNSKSVAVYDSVMLYYATSMNKIYKRQDYVHRDAAMAITYRNAALISATHLRNYADAHNQYEQYLETIWYHCRDNDSTLAPSSKTSDNPLLASRSLVVCQALYGLGLVERKLRQYGAARHYQREGLGLLIKAKKQHLCGKCAPPTVQNAKRMANLQTAMGREFQLLNSGCKWISWLMD